MEILIGTQGSFYLEAQSLKVMDKNRARPGTEVLLSLAGMKRTLLRVRASSIRPALAGCVAAPEQLEGFDEWLAQFDLGNFPVRC